MEHLQSSVRHVGECGWVRVGGYERARSMDPRCPTCFAQFEHSCLELTFELCAGGERMYFTEASPRTVCGDNRGTRTRASVCEAENGEGGKERMSNERGSRRATVSTNGLHLVQVNFVHGQTVRIATEARGVR